MIGPVPQPPIEGDQNEDQVPIESEGIVPSGDSAPYSASGAQWWVLFGAVFLVGAALFVHLELWPLLPIEVSPEDASCLLGLALVAMSVGALALLLRLSMFVVSGLSRVGHRISPRNARVRCPECGAWDTAQHFVDVQQCWQCGADRVRCDACGTSQAVGRFVSGLGCSECGHGQFSTWA